MKNILVFAFIFSISESFSQKFVMHFGPSVGFCASRGLNKVVDNSNTFSNVLEPMKHMKTFKGWYVTVGAESGSQEQAFGVSIGFAFQKTNLMYAKLLVDGKEKYFAIQPRLFNIMPFKIHFRSNKKLPYFFGLSIFDIARFTVEKREGSFEDIQIKSGYRVVKPLALGSWFGGLEFGFTFPFVDLVFHAKNTAIGAFDHDLGINMGQDPFERRSYRYGEIGVDLRIRLGGY